MDREENLEKKYGRQNPFKVPDDYFASLDRRIMEELPSYPEKPRYAPQRGWQKFKPYIYLAAMFAGIWLMMKVFHNVSGMTDVNFDNPPQAVISMIDDNDYYPVYLESSYEPDFMLEDEVINSYDNFDDFQKDFGYELKPEYESYLISG